jgi:sulfite reductase beta subunit-like hemoprotein
MYQYDDLDQAFIDNRTEQFADQVARRLDGKLSEDHFRPLRLMNGLYLQLHAYMLRVAIPYGTLTSAQLRGLATVARKFDRGYGHFTTRQNVQFNWTRLDNMPDILAALAEIQMHAVQTSGNCIRNVTADHLAGVAPDEIEDPRSSPICRASSRSPSAADRATGQPSRCTTSHSNCAATRPERSALWSWLGAARGARRSSPRPSELSCPNSICCPI